MHDSKFEDRLRTVLRAEGDGLPMTITAAELERRLAGRQRQDHGRRLVAIAAVIAFVAVGAVAAMTNGWLRLPAVGTTPSPSPTETPHESIGPAATPLAGIVPITATPGRTQIARGDPQAPEPDEASGTIETQTRGATSVIATVACVGTGTFHFEIGGESIDLLCGAGDSVTRSRWFSVSGPGLAATTDALGSVSYAWLIETPAPGETAPPVSSQPCTTVDPQQLALPIELSMGSSGDSIAYGGVLGAYRLRTTVGTPGHFVDPGPSVEAVPADALTGPLQVLASGSDACIVDIEADAVPIGQLDAKPLLLSIDGSDPARVRSIGAPPTGSWVVRVRALFSTTVDEVWTETFFKVDVTEPAFTPPTMSVGASVLAVGGEGLVLSTGCVATYDLADGTHGTNACSGDWEVPTPGEPLDVGWSGDITFVFADGWQFKNTLISSAGLEDVLAGTVGAASEMERAGETPVASLTVAGWRFTGDNVLRIEGTFVKGTESFTAAYTVVVHGPSKEPAVKNPAVPCGAPDRSASAPPLVRLIADGKQVATGEFGTTGWNGSFSDSPADPVPGDAVTIKAGTHLELRIDGNVCATGWSVRFGPIPTGSDGPPSVQTAGSLVLYHRAPGTGKEARQNQFTLAALPRGEWIIIGGFGYDDGDAVVGWHVVVE